MNNIKSVKRYSYQVYDIDGTLMTILVDDTKYENGEVVRKEEIWKPTGVSVSTQTISIPNFLTKEDFEI